MSCCEPNENEAERRNEYKLKNLSHKNSHAHPELEVNRTCRDIYSLPFFILVWVGIIIIAVFAFSQGVTPERLIHGDDYLGNVCGANNLLNKVIVDGLAPRTDTGRAMNFENQPYVWFGYPFDDSTDPNLKYTKARICVSACPDYISLDEKDLICLYPYKDSVQITLVAQSKCFLPYSTGHVFNRCVPDRVIANHSSTAVTDINNRNLSEQLFASLYTALPALFVCLGGAFALAFLWLFLIRFFAAVAVWTTVLCSALLLGTLAALFGYTSNSLYLFVSSLDPLEVISLDNSNQIFLAIMCIITVVVTIFVALVIIFNGKNIIFAVYLLEETSKAVRYLPFLLVIPFIPFIFLGGIYVFFLEVAIHLGASTIPLYDSNGNLIGYNYNYPLKASVILHIIGCIWTCNLIIAILRVTVAGAVSEWYFEGKGLKGFVVLRSFIRTIRYNLGSLVLASFILPITEIPRGILMFTKFLSRQFGLCNSCVDSWHSNIEAINTHSYSMMAIYGYGFKKASRSGFYVIQSSSIRVGAISCITNTMLSFGKLFIMSFSTAALVIYLDLTDETHLWIFPILFMGVASYYLASCFMDIYVSASQTLILCFIEDYERNQREDHNFSQSLRVFFEDNAKRPICNPC